MLFKIIRDSIIISAMIILGICAYYHYNNIPLVFLCGVACGTWCNVLHSRLRTMIEKEKYESETN